MHDEYTELRFSGKEVITLLEHARRAEKHAKLSPEHEGPGLLLVKGSGIYIMSNGDPPLRDDNGNTIKFYADGFEPPDGESYAHQFVKIHEAITSPFAEFLPDRNEIQSILPNETLLIKVNEYELRIFVETRPRPERKNF